MQTGCPHTVSAYIAFATQLRKLALVSAYIFLTMALAFELFLQYSSLFRLAMSTGVV